MIVDAKWHEDAACRDADPDLFFPRGATGSAQRQIEQATRICRTCLVRTECLAWALDHEVTDGVWGGTTMDQRRAIRRLPVTMTISQEGSDRGSSHPLEHREQAGREQATRSRAAQAAATRIRRGAGVGPDAGGKGAVAARDAERHQPEGGRMTGDFTTADGESVLVAALSPSQFADLAKITGLTRTFAFLERLLLADFSDRADLYTHRATITALLVPWFAERTVTDLATAFAGTSVPWTRVHDLCGLSERHGRRRYRDLAVTGPCRAASSSRGY
jgi:WhiB family transcriptional regulator, redox-sensing transcriptional regulator